MGLRLVTQCEDNQLQPELYWSQNVCSALSGTHSFEEIQPYC